MNPSSDHPSPGPELPTRAPPREWACSEGGSRRSATRKTSTAPSTKDATAFSGALGTVLSKSPGASTDSTVVGGGSRLATALTSDFSHANLSGIGDDVADLTAALNPPARNRSTSPASPTARQHCWAL